jgi:hypothetical protein
MKSITVLTGIQNKKNSGLGIPNPEFSSLIPLSYSPFLFQWQEHSDNAILIVFEPLFSQCFLSPPLKELNYKLYYNNKKSYHSNEFFDFPVITSLLFMSAV